MPSEHPQDASRLDAHKVALAKLAKAAINLGRAEIDHHLGEISQEQWESFAKAYQDADEEIGTTLAALVAAPPAGDRPPDILVEQAVRAAIATASGYWPAMKSDSGEDAWYKCWDAAMAALRAGDRRPPSGAEHQETK